MLSTHVTNLWVEESANNCQIIRTRARYILKTRARRLQRLHTTAEYHTSAFLFYIFYAEAAQCYFPSTYTPARPRPQHQHNYTSTGAFVAFCARRNETKRNDFMVLRLERTGITQRFIYSKIANNCVKER